MLRALDKQSGTVVIPSLATSRERTEWKKNRSFSCPACNQPVIFKTGSKVIPHFAHKAAASCHLQEGGEGDYHEKGKLNLYKWLQRQNVETELEAYLPGIQQRPDLLLTIKEKKIALEYQCAAISSNDFIKRTAGYLAAGITPIWILGGNRQKRAGADSLILTSTETMFLHQFNSTFTPLLYYYCSIADQFAFFHHILFTGRRTAHGQLHFQSLASLDFADLFHPVFQWKQKNKLPVSQPWKEEVKKRRTRPPSLYSHLDKQWYNWLYGQHLHPSLLPSIIGLPVPSQFKFQHPPTVWQSKLLIQLLHPLPLGKWLTLQQARRLLASSSSSIDQFPLVQKSSCPVEEYLELLVHIGVLAKKSWCAYEKRKDIIFPDRIDHALQADEELYAFLSS